MRILVALPVVVSLLAAVPLAQDGNWIRRLGSNGDGSRPPGGAEYFQRVATVANYLNTADPSDATVSEIVAASADGRTLVYTDAAGGTVGFIDLTDPAHPVPDGTIALDPDPSDDTGYSPTSVAVLDNTYALVAVDTSESFANPSGTLVVLDLGTRATVATIDLGGQPDSVDISPDKQYIAVAIENQRDEDVVVDDVEGGLPQAPAGYLAVIAVGPQPAAWTRQDVALVGLADYAPSDPEPEFVDINAANQAVVTLQENNHIVIVDLPTLTVVGDFPAGSVTLHGIDATEDGVIRPEESLADVPREPDAVAWVPGPGGQLNIATANEGDLFGGSRGFSIFRRNGQATFDSGAALDEIAIRHGHYPEERSENKGNEPEAIEFARFGTTDYLFIASERGSFVAVYTLNPGGRPVFRQLLPTPLGPEGLLAIPERGLLVVSGEEDTPTFGVRSTVMIYELKAQPPAYPQVVSTSAQPIPWAALSGLVAVPGQVHSLLAVWDGFFAESRILRIDAAQQPARITDSLLIHGGNGNYDPEGIALAPDGTVWVASEGTADDSRQNLLVQLDGDGQVLAEIGLPDGIIACRAASTKRGTLGSGFEGVAVLPEGGIYRLLVAQQRGWDYTTENCEALDDDGGGLNSSGEPNQTRIWIYDPQLAQWSAVAWQLAPKPANASWVGLSEISATGTGDYIVIERDNRTGDFGVLKTLAKVAWSAGGDGLFAQADKSVVDLLPHLKATNGWITDKPEGTAIGPFGDLYVVTDNDGVDGWSGETWFFNLGPYWTAFAN